MKKTIIITLSIIFSFAGVNAQDQLLASNIDLAEGFQPKTELSQLQQAYPTYAARPGDELIKFSRMYYTGLGLLAGGYVIAIAAVVSYVPEVAIAGAVASTAGIITMFASHSHIGKAGRMMNQLDDQYRREIERQNQSSGGSGNNIKINSSENGVGFAYNF